MLAALVRQPLDRRRCAVADAIDRKDHDIGLADEAGQQRRIVIDSAVVMQQVAVHAVGQRLELRHLIAPPADVQHGQAMKIESIRRIGGGIQEHADTGFERGQFLIQLPALRFRPPAGLFDFLQHLRLHGEALLESFAARGFSRQAAVQAGDGVGPGRGVLVGQRNGGVTGLHRGLGQRLAQLADDLLAFGKAVADLLLLAVELGG